MTDLERLDEALAMVENTKDYSTKLEIILAEAARAYRDLLANGEWVEWCEEHRSFVRPERPGGNPGMRECESVSLRRLREDRSTFIMCSIVSKLLIDYPKEADNE